MFEKQWVAVAPTLFTSNGSANGYIQVVDTKGFKVKATAIISATSQPNLTVQIKRVISPTQMVVGPLNTAISNTQVDLSAYTVAAGAFIFQDQQPRVTIAPADIIQAVYEQEPVVAIRTESVDQYGNPYGVGNPLPIAFEGTIAIGDVSIVDQTTHDPVKVNPDGSINVKVEAGSFDIGTVEITGPSGHLVDPNADGSINVNVLPSTNPNDTVKNIFDTVSGVVAGVLTNIVSYTVPSNKTAILERSAASGENIGTYTLSINGITQSVQRTYYAGGFNVAFEFTTGQNNGLVLQPGDVVLVTILHNRPDPANFDARIQVLEILT